MSAESKLQMCTRCIMDAGVPDIRFDAHGVCNFCHMQDKLEALFPLGDAGRREMERLADQMRRAGKGRDFDCVCGVSGGRDSSYCLYVVKELGLRPLAVHFDNGWDSDIAKENIRKICQRLNVELHSVIADWEESRDLTNATIKACVPYIDLTDDVGIASALWRTAAKENIKHIVLAHSFREEGVTPLKWNYFDGRYVRALINQHSTMKYKKFKNVDLHHVFWWAVVRGIRVVNLTNYYDDTGTKVERILNEELGLADTGQHHYDNEIFALVYYYARHKFGFDWRVVELSARVRTGVLTREEALDIMQEKPFFENKDVVGYCLKKQGWTWEEFEAILAAPNKYYTDYPNWHSLLKLFKQPIKVLSRMHAFPAHAYEKYFEA